MVEEDRDRADVLTQLSARSKTVERAGFALAGTGMQQCLASDGPNRGTHAGAMETLVRSLA